MQKYLAIFKISFEQEFAYKLNFVMWRVRNVLSILLVYFLWDTVFSDSDQIIFGYDRTKILTYVFGLIFMRSIVLSIRSIDIAGEIARGDVSNLLLKPISYFKYWFTRDLSSKLLNLIFAVFEIGVLYIILKPPIYLQNNGLLLILFILSLAISVLLYFLLVFLFSMPPFWIPHQAWGFMFLLMVFGDILGGGVFPLDILPLAIQKLIYLTPFPYLIFVPIEIYLGNYTFDITIKHILFASGWVLLLVILNKKVWELGIKAYKAEGK